jgi:hypothetical protein
MLLWPRSAFMPPPAMPMLPSSSCMMAAVRIICEPTLCCVQPSAYMMVMALPGTAVPEIISQTLRNLSLGVPVMRLTSSGV